MAPAWTYFPFSQFWRPPEIFGVWLWFRDTILVVPYTWQTVRLHTFSSDMYGVLVYRDTVHSIIFWDFKFGICFGSQQSFTQHFSGIDEVWLGRKMNLVFSTFPWCNFGREAPHLNHFSSLVKLLANTTCRLCGTLRSVWHTFDINITTIGNVT
jgi:hypothetical protein